MDEIVYKMILRLVLQNAFDISPVVVVNVFFFVGFVFFFSVKLRLTSHWFIFFLIFCLSILLLSHLSLLIFGFLENSPFSFRIMFFFICICYCFFFRCLSHRSFIHYNNYYYDYYFDVRVEMALNYLDNIMFSFVMHIFIEGKHGQVCLLIIIFFFMYTIYFY